MNIIPMRLHTAFHVEWTSFGLVGTQIATIMDKCNALHCGEKCEWIEHGADAGWMPISGPMMAN